MLGGGDSQPTGSRVIEARLAQAANENGAKKKLQGSSPKKRLQPSRSYSGPRDKSPNSYSAPGGPGSKAASSYNAPGGPGQPSGGPATRPRAGASGGYDSPRERGDGLSQPENEAAGGYNAPGGPGSSGGARSKAPDSYNAPGGPGRSNGPGAGATEIYGAPGGPGRSGGPKAQSTSKDYAEPGKSNFQANENIGSKATTGLYSAPSDLGGVEASGSYKSPGGPGAGRETSQSRQPSGSYGAPGESDEGAASQGLDVYNDSEGSGESSGSIGSGSEDPNSYNELEDDYGGTLPIEESYGGPSGEGDTNVFQGGINDIYDSPSASEDYGIPTEEYGSPKDVGSGGTASDSYLGPGLESSGKQATSNDGSQAGYRDEGEEGSSADDDGEELSGYGQEEDLSGYEEDLRDFEEDSNLGGYEGDEASGGQLGEDYSGQGEYSGQGDFSGTPLVEEYSGASLSLLPPPSGRRGKVSVERAPKEKTSKSKLIPQSKTKKVTKSKSIKSRKSKSIKISKDISISRKRKELQKLKPPSSKNRSGPKIRSVNSLYHYY